MAMFGVVVGGGVGVRAGSWARVTLPSHWLAPPTLSRAPVPTLPVPEMRRFSLLTSMPPMTVARQGCTDLKDVQPPPLNAVLAMPLIWIS